MAKVQFTSAQKSALRTDKNLFVEAGAGSGKTAVLVSRYLACLREHPECNPDHILAITFTKKAAQEMKERIHDSLLDPEIDHEKEAFRYRTLEQLHKAHISTIHGCCSEILKEYPIESECDPQSRVLDGVSAYRLQREIVMMKISSFHKTHPEAMQILGAAYTFAQLREKLVFMFKNSAAVLLWRSYIISPELSFEEDPGSEIATREAMALMDALGQLFEDCYTAYQKLKSDRGEIDYADQVSKTLTLLKKYPVIQKRYQTQFRFIMVDEFQDTDPEQWELLELLTHPDTTNLFIVGDQKQAIYGFRGADSHLFEQVKSEFSLKKRHEVVALDDNFRSQKQVLDWINHVFMGLFSQGKATISYHSLIPHRIENTGTVTVKIEEDLEEADAIITWIHSTLNTSPSLALHDIAILCRTKQGMTSLKTKLEKAGLPVTLHHRGGKVQENALIMVLTWIRFLENPHDNLGFLSILIEPQFLGLSGEEWKALVDTKKDKSWWEAIQELPQWQDAKNSLLTLMNAFETSPFNEALLQLMIFLGLEKEDLLQNLLRQCQAAEFSQAWALCQGKEWLESLFELGQSDQEEVVPTKGSVQIMTIHASKGLEFPCVVIPFCGKKFNFSAQDPILFLRNEFPGLAYKTHNGKGTNLIREALLRQKRQATLEEEKRVFYVACTRARDHLLLLGKVDSLEKTQKSAQENPDSFAAFLLATPP